jgi:hypothetical protein
MLGVVAPLQRIPSQVQISNCPWLLSIRVQSSRNRVPGCWLPPWGTQLRQTWPSSFEEPGKKTDLNEEKKEWECGGEPSRNQSFRQMPCSQAKLRTPCRRAETVWRKWGLAIGIGFLGKWRLTKNGSAQCFVLGTYWTCSSHFRQLGSSTSANRRLAFRVVQE